MMSEENVIRTLREFCNVGEENVASILSERGLSQYVIRNRRIVLRLFLLEGRLRFR